MIGWLEGALDVPSMAENIAAQIQKQITPVNEDLYFTWQNPPIPPVEVYVCKKTSDSISKPISLW